jgi:hypothetical protein
MTLIRMINRCRIFPLFALHYISYYLSIWYGVIHYQSILSIFIYSSINIINILLATSVFISISLVQICIAQIAVSKPIQTHKLFVNGLMSTTSLLLMPTGFNARLTNIFHYMLRVYVNIDYVLEKL